MKGMRQARRAGALLAIALLAVACSNGTSGPGVAGAGSTPAAGGSSSASSGQSGMAKGIAYAQCMRSHGVTNFPDPQPGGAWALTPGVVNSPHYQSATQACGQPPNLGGGAPPAPLSAAQQKQYLKWAACIRAHGDPSFKDPVFKNGRPAVVVGPSDTSFNSVSQACQSYLRGIPGAGGATTG